LRKGFAGRIWPAGRSLEILFWRMQTKACVLY